LLGNRVSAQTEAWTQADLTAATELGDATKYVMRVIFGSIALRVHHEFPSKVSG
jgi:hypothetical protein